MLMANRVLPRRVDVMQSGDQSISHYIKQSRKAWGVKFNN